MKNLYDQVQESAAFIQEKSNQHKPKLGIVLGTGLSNLGDQIDNKISIPYQDIPNFPVSTVAGHTGHLILGTFENQPVVIMQGRFHYYEGYTNTEVTFPIRVMHALGASQLIISNASGGLREDLRSGDIVAIEDHINYQPENPLRGINDDRLGTRFPDMTDAYNPSMRAQVQVIARNLDISVHSGIYLGLQGPNLETQAELRFFKTIGADLVGMSTVPEVIVARQCDMDVLALSVVTNECLPPDGIVSKTTIEEVIKVANKTEPLLTSLVKEYIRNQE